MESPELPECPVCLQTYNNDHTIPRVLSCGHTTCETCLKNLPQKYPQTIRCPACTQLIKFPPQGPSFLPKNIELLRLNPNFTQPPKKTLIYTPQLDSVPRLWSDGFYSKWKNWIIPGNGVLVEDKEKGSAFLKESNTKVRLFNVIDALLPSKGKNSVYELNYVARVMNLLHGMEEQVIEELNYVLSIKHCRICRAYGLWLDVKEGVLCLVSEKLDGNILDRLPQFENGLSKELLACFSMIGTEMCEIVVALQMGNSYLGCLSLSCFELDGFGHVNMNLTDILSTRRTIHNSVMETKIGEKDIGTLVTELFKKEIFISPEILFKVLNKEGLELDFGSSVSSLVYKSDIWSLACVLLRLLIGKLFTDELVDYVVEFLKLGEENISGLYLGLMEKVSSLLGTKLGEEFEPLQKILCKCLNFDPENRPLVIDLWKCVRELILGNKFEAMVRLDDCIHEKDKGHCLVLGELALAFEKMSKVHNESGENGGQSKDITGKRDFVEGLIDGNVKVKDMKGHLDCVTGLAIGGGFLFSSSFDKSVRVWSLEDFSHTHTFKGHEHKVTAVIYVEESEPLCISSDSEGCICLWSLAIPLRQEPIKKWFEEKDWRYSGIQALTTANNGYLYTGSGDRSIKAWSLQDGVVACTMNGHKSVVSTLASCDGVLYSGSWDGTIRLWSLSDHSLLTVLGEENPGTMASVLSIIVRRNLLAVGLENGEIKIWRNDVFMKSVEEHKGAVFALGMDGNRLFTGGWDKGVRVQELSGDDFEVDIRSIGSIPSSSAVSSLVYWQGKLFVGYGDRNIKVYYYGK